MIIFRDAIVDLLVMELGSKMSTLAQNSLSAFLSYVGGAYIYIRKNYSERIRSLVAFRHGLYGCHNWLHHDAFSCLY